MEDNYINELDKEFKKSRWLRGGPGGKENREMRDEEAFEPESADSDNEDQDMGILENDTALE